MIRKNILRIISGLFIGVAFYFLIAVSLVFTQWPGDVAQTQGLNFDKLERTAGDDASSLISFTARDGSKLYYRSYGSDKDNAPLVILIHGSGWHGGSYLKLAKSLSSDADILVPDLRGHGSSPKRRGDVDYVGQLEDDIADLIQQKKKKGQKIILIGHSSGGGMVIRFAGGAHRAMFDGAVLIAPYLRYNAPTVRPNSGGWAHPLTRKIIGLTMLNNVGVRVFNSHKVVQFNFPQKILKGRLGHTATPAYSYRLQKSYSPRSDYLNDMAGLPRFLLVAGTDDEAFFADRYEETLSRATSKGKYQLIDGLSHFDVINSEKTRDLILQFLRGD